ncbi:glycosyltransferase [Halopseudomonas salegens]|uniref:Glycosyltransferase involved in cell wall bisynthesis n=1 Tax=Halopseudomonas salegens TaxID=1434072 RepID=A0A1H2DXH9_9GAMM|nr:glycosyltransferase [Halopseudomonas salegens]SDT87537.1 Glycosyltransferase involved in cell wall bisynthesis [Halopseudomonas salegens]
MQKPSRLQLAYYLVVLLVLVLITYQLYLFFSESRYASMHVAQLEEIHASVGNEQVFSFAVIGNINNSSNIFQKQMIPVLNQSEHRFLISAGNAVSSGAEENYRSLLNMLAELEMPWLLTYGENENSDFGDFRYYQYLGPYFFSFTVGNNHFIFLDGTGNSPYRWQLDWLSRELDNSEADNRFLFVGLPLHPPLEETPIFEEDNYFSDPEIARQLLEIIEQGEVDMVFSTNLSLLHETNINGVQHITTGGGGGIIVDGENSFHHYLAVSVNGDQIAINPITPDIGKSSLLRTLDSIWSAIYTFFYVSLARLLIIVSVLVLVGLKLREIIYQDRDFYTHFSIDDSQYRQRKKRIVFFTNNFFPFISGVTLSIQRLSEGLKQLGHHVHIVAPDYGKSTPPMPDITRVRTLLSFGQSREFRLTNPLQAGLKKQMNQLRPDLVHVHHPFWLGSLGMWRAKRAGVPVIYTYHTRLEMYAHYVPLPGALFRNVISHLIIRRFCNKCNGIVVPTYSTAEYLRLIGVDRQLFVQPTGVEFAHFNQPHRLTREHLRQQLGLGITEKVLISVSRLGKEKNIKFLLDALAELQKNPEQPVRLVLVGQGDDKAFLQKHAQSLGVADRVVFAGPVKPEDMPAYYQMADLFVFASKSETQGMVILEAMSAGLPVVAIRSSGIDDVIDDGHTGYKTLDDIGIWSSKVSELLGNEEKRLQFSHAAVAVAEQHDVSVFANNIDGFYSEVLAAFHAEQAT